MTPSEAEAILRGLPGYDWLLSDGRSFWSPSDLEPYLGFSAQTIRRWADAGLIPGSLDFGQAGFRIPKEGLMIYLASRIAGNQKQQA